MKKGSTTAYPCHPEARDIGMTLREHFAGLAMQGVLADSNIMDLIRTDDIGGVDTSDTAAFVSGLAVEGWIMSELKIEHCSDGVQEKCYVITAPDNGQSICWECDADYKAVKSLQDTIEGLVKKLHELERYSAMNAMDELLDDGWQKSGHYSKMLGECREVLAAARGEK